MALIAAAPIALEGCAPEAWKLELPLQESTRTAILTLGSQHWAVVLDRSGMRQAPLSIAAETERIELAEYDLEPGALGVSPGEAALPFASARCALLRPISNLALDLFEGAEWEPVPATESRAQRFISSPQTTCTPCVEFIRERLDLRTRARVSFAIPASPEGALIGLSDGSLIRVERSEEEPIGWAASTLCTGDGIGLDGGMQEDEGTLWLTQHEPTRLSRLELQDQSALAPCRTSTTFRVAAEPAPLDRIRWLAQTTEGPDRPLYFLFDSGLLGRWNRGEWRELLRLGLDFCEDGRCTSTDRGSLEKVAEGTVFAVAGGTEVAWVREGVAELADIQVKRGFPARVLSTATIPGFGLVVGLGEEGLAHHTDEGWTVLGVSGAKNVAGLSPFRNGIAYTPRVGTVGQYYPEYGHCPLVQGLSLETVRWPIELDGDTLLLPDISNRSPEQGGSTELGFLIALEE